MLPVVASSFDLFLISNSNLPPAPLHTPKAVWPQGGKVRRTCSCHFVIVKHSLLLSHLTLSFLRYKNNAENTSSCSMWVCVCECACVSVGFDRPPPFALFQRVAIVVVVVMSSSKCSGGMCSCSRLPVHSSIVFPLAFFDSVLKIHLAAIRRQLLCLDATFIKCFMVLNIKLYMDK